MLIEPEEPVELIIQVGDVKYLGYMLSLSESKIEVSCNEYLEKNTFVLFNSPYFKGHALVKEIKFAKRFFIYQLAIEQIKFQPGLLVNMRL